MGKKKGKANKLARMSEDERIRYLQQRAAIEAEIKMRREKLISEFMKQKLKHEDTFTRLNLAKINQHWRQILRQIKNKELHIELKHLSSEFGNMIERKNIMIQKLLNELQENEEFYCRNYREHTYLINNLLDMYKERILDVNKIYYKELKYIMNKNTIQNASINNNYLEWEKYLKITSLALQLRFDKIVAQMDGKQNSKVDELKADLRIIKEMTESQFHLKMKQLWVDYENDTNETTEYIDNIKNEYEQLLHKDQNNSKDIKKLIRQEIQLKETQNVILAKLNKVEKIKELNINQLTNQVEYLENYFSKLQTKLFEQREFDAKQLIHLTTYSNNTINKLKEILSKGEKIICFGKLSNRLETQDERSLPIGYVLPSEKFVTKEEEDEMLELLKKEKAEMGLEFPSYSDNTQMNESMQLFWRQFNKTFIDSHQLREWNHELMEENLHLQRLIKTYLGRLTHRAQEPRPRTGPIHAQPRPKTREIVTAIVRSTRPKQMIRS